MKLHPDNFQPAFWQALKPWSIGLGVSLLLSHASVGGAAPVPQADPATDPNTGFTGVQVPYTSIKPINGQIRIHFINETGSPIDYQVIGDTQYRSLPGRSQMTLEKLRLPTTFTFRRADNGFLQVALTSDSSTGTLTLQVRETADFGADRTSVYVDQNGRVYLN
jgi:hypothetical protein